MLGLLEVLGAVAVIVFAGLVLWGLYWLLINLLNDFVNRRLVELYKQKDNLWLGVNDAYDNCEDLSEKVWDYDVTKKKLDLLTKDLLALEEYVLGDIEPIKEKPIQGVVYDFDYSDIVYGKYLYDKTREDMCFVLGWDKIADRNCLVLKYASDNYKKVVNVEVNDLKEFNKWFYLTVSQEPNATGYVKDYI